MSDTNVNLAESKSNEIYAVAWVFTGMAIVVVIAKLYSKLRIIRQLDWDDFFIVLGLLCSITASALVTYSAEIGLGKHTEVLLSKPDGMETLIFAAKIQMLGYPFNIGAYSFPNIAIAILIHKLLEPNRTRTFLIYFVAILQVVLGFTSVCIILLQCSPTERLWNPSVEGTCLNPNVFNYSSYFLGAYTAFCDIILAVVPINAFWRLQMKFSTKLGLCIMMGLTFLSAIFTIVKTCYLNLFTDKTDPLWNVVILVDWGLIEQNIVIIAACFPTLRPYFKRAGEAFKSSKKNSSGRSSSNKLSNGSVFQGLSSKHQQIAEVPLDEFSRPDTPKSKSSRQGILRTVGYSVERRSDDDVDLHV